MYGKEASMRIACIVFFPIICAFASYLLGRAGKGRDNFVILAAFAELFLTLTLLSGGATWEIPGIMAYGLSFTTDGFRIVYAVITAVMWAGTTLFSKEYFAHERENLNRYWFFVLVTLGATEGVMLSADLMTAFVFFEILSFTSFTWVIHEETAGAVRAAYTYLFIAVIGGLVLFFGLLAVRYTAGTLAFAELPAAAAAVTGSQKNLLFAGGICILTGFGCKAGMFPVHIWLPKAHPVAPSPASALLSGILTKVGIYGILMTSLQAFVKDQTFGLIVLLLGTVTMVLGAVIALFSINLKRTLACSSMSQIGFILTGIGMTVLITSAGHHEGAFTALSGAMLHMVNHSLIKLTLFMAAGVVVMRLHTLTLDDIRGYGRNKLLFKLAFAFGGLGISGVPLFNGYLSKTLLHEGIVEGIELCASLAPLLHVIEWVFLFSGGCTFAYMLKLFICIFVEKNGNPARQALFDKNRSCMNGASTAAVFGSSLLMIILGQPAVTKRLGAFMTGSSHIMEFSAFTPENLKGSAISLVIGALLYLIFIRKVLIRKNSYVNLWPARLDLEDLVYRPVLTRWLPLIFGTVAAVFGENKVLKPICKAVPGFFGSIAALFGENKLLGPFCKAALLFGAFIGRVFADSTDALIVFLRKTFVREKKVPTVSSRKVSRRAMLREGTAAALEPLLQNFSFALAMTCVGILVILAVLIYYNHIII